MGYRKAADVLPKQLIAEIQKYIDGEMLYIPRKCEEHSRWGEKSGTRESWELRNRRILEEYCSGKSISDLAENYFLSVKSIQRILREKIPPEGKGRQGGNTIEQRK